MKLSLHLCSIADLDQLEMISRKTFIDAFGAQNNPEDFEHYLNTALTKETLVNELNNAHTSFYFVRKMKETIGYFKINDAKAQTDIQDTSSYELERIYVVSGYQGHGIGEWMINKVVYLAQKAKKDYIWLGVWEENTAAIRFYQKRGFIKFGKHPYYIGRDKQMDWLMKLDLTTL